MPVTILPSNPACVFHPHQTVITTLFIGCLVQKHTHSYLHRTILPSCCCSVTQGGCGLALCGLAWGQRKRLITLSLARTVINLTISFEILSSTSPHSPLQSWRHLCRESSRDLQQPCCCWMWCLEMNQKRAKYICFTVCSSKVNWAWHCFPSTTGIQSKHTFHWAVGISWSVNFPH